MSMQDYTTQNPQVLHSNFAYLSRPQQAQKPVENTAAFSGSGSGLGSIGNFPSHAENQSEIPLSSEQFTGLHDLQPTPAQQRKRLKYRRLKTAAKLLPKEAIAGCQTWVIPEQDYVSVEWNPDTNSTRFHGLVSCDSSSCPHCVEKRSQQERKELTLALAAADTQGMRYVMATLTLRHHIGDKLRELLETLNGAYDKTFSGRWYQSFKRHFAIQGKIKASEYRFGVNGHHPHTHALFFYKLGEIKLYVGRAQNRPKLIYPKRYRKLSVTVFGEHIQRPHKNRKSRSERDIDRVVASMEKRIKARWVKTVKRLGGDAIGEFACDVVSADSKIAAYIAKWGKEPQDPAWGAESELTRQQYKNAKDERSMSIFEILGAAAGETDQLVKLGRIFDDLSDSELAERAGALYVEFFQSMKGKPRLHWGKLKELLQLDEFENAFDAANPPEPDESISILMVERGESWRKVWGAAGAKDLRYELELVCSTGNPYAIAHWLADRGIQGIIPELVWDRWESMQEVGWQPEAALGAIAGASIAF